MDKMVVYTSDGGDPGTGRGCLSSLALALIFVVGVVFFVGALVLIAGVFLAAVLVALVALGINRVLMAVSPRYRGRRDAQGTFQPTTRVIDTTARVIDKTKPKRRN